MELTYFYLPGCPYCKQAREIIKELISEHPEYANVKITEVNEITQRKIVSQYDYYYVPCFWIGKEKLYEADPNDPADVVKEKLNAVFQRALA